MNAYTKLLQLNAKQRIIKLLWPDMSATPLSKLVAVHAGRLADKATGVGAYQSTDLVTWSFQGAC